ncbi:hypothetical protein [Klenkia brasiliensis]|uniref:Uncharacterized protein n=1 Tax=Klenkia brasiliensis TaxID=333142 RepID=A0A1G7YP81_9ACTN|nr:hypothetical protein [Klenkia brasiliensis]SDG98323.1 hypothetical protein SAMN05660324_4040 [Klenkia brasiliensis]
MLRARVLAVLVGVVGVLALAGPASAHVGDGRAGSDFDGRVLAVTPALPGVTVRVLQFGDELEVVNPTGTELAVPGYSGEPYLRIGPDGVWRNRLSPATTINLDRYGRTPLPADADPLAAPDWVQVSTQPSYTWHDHRTHWMSEGQLPPTVAADPTRDHEVLAWTVPMAYGGTDVAVTGELTWSPPPPGWLVWPLYAALLVAVVAAGVRGPAPLAGALGLGAGASLWHALATPVPAVTQSSHTGALLSALLPALLVTAVAVLGIRAARRGRAGLTGVLAVVAGWLLLVQGLPDVDVLWTANVLATGPALLARAAVAVLLAGGLGLVVGGALAARRARRVETEPLPA